MNPTHSPRGGQAPPPPTPCPKCGSTETIKRIAPPGSLHFAWRECAGCGRRITWLRRPVTARPHVRRRLTGQLLPTLRGTRAQVNYASNLRADMIRLARRAGDREAIAIISSVVDPRWFFMNRGESLDTIRWPKPGENDPAALVADESEVDHE